MGIIVEDPDILGGTPVFRGTRVPVQTFFDHLEARDKVGGFLEGFPTVSRQTVIATMEEAKQLLLSPATPLFF